MHTVDMLSNLPLERSEYNKNLIVDATCVLFSEKGLEIFKLDNSVFYDRLKTCFKFKDIERFNVYTEMSFFSKSLDKLKNTLYGEIQSLYSTIDYKINNYRHIIKSQNAEINDLKKYYNISDELLLQNVEQSTNLKIDDVKFSTSGYSITELVIVDIVDDLVLLNSYGWSSTFTRKIIKSCLYDTKKEAVIKLIQYKQNEIKKIEKDCENILKFFNDIPKNVKILKNYKNE